MRKDLAKCTTECYRRGAGSIEHVYKIKFGGKIKVHPDPEHEYDNEHGGFHSSSRHRHKESKDFGDKLGALRGNIRANVGRPWDAVFSEFCRLLDRRSMSGYHIWTHLRQEVSTKTYMHNGAVWEYSRYGGEIPVDGFYVHPITGVLEYKEPEWSKARRRARYAGNRKITLPVPGNEGWYYEELDGLWFRCKQDGTKWIKREHEIPTFVEVPNFIKRSCNRKEIVLIKEQIAKLLID